MGHYLEIAKKALREREKEQSMGNRLVAELEPYDGEQDRQCFACGETFTHGWSVGWLCEAQDEHKRQIGILCPACLVEGPAAVKKYLLEQANELRRIAKLAGEVQQDGWLSPTSRRLLLNGAKVRNADLYPDLPF